MKKTYINPEICIEEMAEDIFLETMMAYSGSEGKLDENLDVLSKERESVNFSDEESIW